MTEEERQNYVLPERLNIFREHLKLPVNGISVEEAIRRYHSTNLISNIALLERLVEAGLTVNGKIDALKHAISFRYSIPLGAIVFLKDTKETYIASAYINEVTKLVNETTDGPVEYGQTVKLTLGIVSVAHDTVRYIDMNDISYVIHNGKIYYKSLEGQV